MEFACGFVYVPPSLTQKEVKRNNPIQSALLPPVNRVRPCKPPPPPPTEKGKAHQSPTSLLKNSEHLEKHRKGQARRPTAFVNENEDSLRKPEKATFTGAVSQPTTPKQKAALLPPGMRCGANTDSNKQLHVYHNANDQEYLHEDSDVSCDVSEGSSNRSRLPSDSGFMPATRPDFPSEPPCLNCTPEYLVVLPSGASPPQTPSLESSAKSDLESLPGNPNIILISLGKLLSEETEPTRGEPSLCPKCDSVLDNFSNNQVTACYFCQIGDLTSIYNMPRVPSNCIRDDIFLLSSEQPPVIADDTLLLFCIDASGSMSIIPEGLQGNEDVQKSRLQFVQDAVLRCVQKLSEQQPKVRVGLITFNYKVTVHGHGSIQSIILTGSELNDSNYLKEVAASFPVPPPLSRTKDYLQKQVLGLCANGETALGPAALLAVAMASRQPGSKVIICTDGKANAKFGNLEEEDNDSRTLHSSTIFYKELGEYAANQGVTVSVLSIEGTDCRLDELGRLADRTRGRVAIASPDRLHSEFEEIIQNRTTATHCVTTLLLPKSLRLKGEREAGHKGTREVGNVNPDTEITIQFGANEQSIEVLAPAPGSRLFIQLQIRYKKRRQTLLRVLTVVREVTDNSSVALSSLSLAVLQINLLQASAALAIRGRFADAKREGDLQQRLIERAIEHNQSTEDKQTFDEWVKTIEPIYNNIHNFTRRKTVISDAQPLTDDGAAMLFTLKNSNRKSLKVSYHQ